jgi:hypothetical protein
MNRSASATRAAFDDPWRRVSWTVIGVKAQATKNRLVVTRRKNPLRITMLFAIAIPAIAGITGLLSVGFASAQRGIADEALATTMLASIAAIFLLGAFIGSSTTALQALYLADDIPFLLTLPIPLRALFGSKFVEAAVGALPPGILFIASMLGYGIVRSDGPLFWVVSPIVGFSVVTLATSVSVIVVSIVTRFIPPRRARLFLLAISVFLVSCTVVAWRFLSPRPEALGEVVNRDEYEPIWNALAWTPVGWGATAMSNAATGNAVRALVLVGLLVATSVVTVSFSFNIFRRTFIRGLTQTRAVQALTPNASFTRWLRQIGRPLPRRLGAVVLKEWLVLFRDLRRMTGAIWPGGIVLVYTVLLGRGGATDFGSRDLAFWSRNGSLALLPWGLSLGISVYSIGSEGRNVHLLRSLPLSATRIFLAKVIASLLPVTFISLGAASLSLWIRHAPLVSSLVLLLLMAWMVAGFVVIDTAAAAIAPNFETDQVQRTIGLTGRLFSFFAGSLFAMATLAAVARLILMTSQPPASLVNLLSITAGQVELFGWPLVVLTTTIAVLVVGVAASIANRQTERLIRVGA